MIKGRLAYESFRTFYVLNYVICIVSHVHDLLHLMDYVLVCSFMINDNIGGICQFHAYDKFH